MATRNMPPWSWNHGGWHRAPGSSASQHHALKSFYADGTGYNSDILRAIYYATNHGAKVINMSFNYTSYSSELDKAVSYATQNGVVCVAAAGNSGMKLRFIPRRSRTSLTWRRPATPTCHPLFQLRSSSGMAGGSGRRCDDDLSVRNVCGRVGNFVQCAPGCGTTAMMISTYGAQVSTQTSTSLLGISLSLTSSTTVSSKTQAANALSHAQWISAPQLGYGRLDTYQAEQAWRSNLGLQ